MLYKLKNNVLSNRVISHSAVWETRLTAQTSAAASLIVSTLLIALSTIYEARFLVRIVLKYARCSAAVAV